MKVIKFLIPVIGALMLLVSCEVQTRTYGNNHRHSNKRIPPGQMKKMYGQQSARDFALGHNKDYYNDQGNQDRGKKKGKKHKHGKGH